MFFDLPLRELERYVPVRSEPADFQDFWDTTLAQARSYPLDPSFTLADFGLTLINTYDVTFRGFGAAGQGMVAPAPEPHIEGPVRGGIHRVRRRPQPPF